MSRSQAIPIVRLRGNLIVSIQQELSDSLVLNLKRDIGGEIVKRGVRGLVIDVSGIDVVDSFIARALRDLAQVARLLGVRTAVAGIDAAMAMTLAEMGLSMQGVHTALNLESALDELSSQRHQEDDETLLDELLRG
jgi:rsbT antagonist protein RsbS